jgi:hypothetical protein
VYCLPPLWGDGYESIAVIGKHRGSRRSIMMIMPSKRTTNWRVQAVHKPEVLRLLDQGFAGRGEVRWRKRDAKSMLVVSANSRGADEPMAVVAKKGIR